MCAANVDYEPLREVQSFLPGTSPFACPQITYIPDTILELNERFQFSIESTNCARISTRSIEMIITSKLY